MDSNCNATEMSHSLLWAWASHGLSASDEWLWGQCRAGVFLMPNSPHSLQSGCSPSARATLGPRMPVCFMQHNCQFSGDKILTGLMEGQWPSVPSGNKEKQSEYKGWGRGWERRDLPPLTQVTLTGPGGFLEKAQSLMSRALPTILFSLCLSALADHQNHRAVF